MTQAYSDEIARFWSSNPEGPVAVHTLAFFHPRWGRWQYVTNLGRSFRATLEPQGGIGPGPNEWSVANILGTGSGGLGTEIDATGATMNQPVNAFANLFEWQGANIGGVTHTLDMTYTPDVVIGGKIRFVTAEVPEVEIVPEQDMAANMSIEIPVPLGAPGWRAKAGTNTINSGRLDCTLTRPTQTVETVDFLPLAFTLVEPSRQSEGTAQELSVAVDGIDGELYRELLRLTPDDRLTPIALVYRLYLDNDPSAPVNAPPPFFEVRQVNAETGQITVSAVAKNLTTRPAGSFYTVERFPTLSNQ